MFFRQNDSQITLSLRAQPGSSLSGPTGVWEDDTHQYLNRGVKSQAQEGKANREILKSLSKWLKVSMSTLELTRGHRSRLKQIRIECGSNAERIRVIGQLNSVCKNL